MEGRKEVFLYDIGYTCPDPLLDLPPVRRLERAKAANIKRLEQIRGIGRYTERDDIVFLVVELEFDRVVTFVPV